MSTKNILVIDDSATIRKLVDTHLSSAGYEIFLAPTAEDGLRLAEEVRPDLILLDHQLPGTTGYEVCLQLSESPNLQMIPVVVSSTLRKRAYAEYTELSNVVDMLPKPYSEELLRTTVANALETAAMVVASQSQGTAVPEVIREVGEADLAGSFAPFGLREVLDFLNNGNKTGVLEVEAERTRIWFHLDRGRIQGVSATGIGEQEAARISGGLPKAIENLAPVLKLTLDGRNGAEVEGFLQLLNRKVLDSRLVAQLLLYQAAMLVRLAFTRRLTAFRFEAGKVAPPLHRNLPLDISLLALLVEGATHSGPEHLPPEEPSTNYVRRAIRGQNLDRAGLSARHMKILGLLSEPRSSQELASLLGWEPTEVRQVLHGFQLAELVEAGTRADAGQFVLYEPNPAVAQHLRSTLREHSSQLVGKVVRDRLALQLVLKRGRPDAVVFAADDEASCKTMKDLFAAEAASGQAWKRIAIVSDPSDCPAEQWQKRIGVVPHAVLTRPYTSERLLDAVEQVLAGKPAAAASPTAAPASPTAASVSPTAASVSMSEPRAVQTAVSGAR